MARDTAGGIAAGPGDGSIGIEKDQVQIGIGARRDNGQLVEPDAAMPIGQRTRQGGGHRGAGFAPVDHHEVIAGPVHFQKGQTGICLNISHGRAYTPGRGNLKSHGCGFPLDAPGCGL